MTVCVTMMSMMLILGSVTVKLGTVVCSEGCSDTCDEDTGHCNCKDWWIGDTCDTEIGEHESVQYMYLLVS